MPVAYHVLGSAKSGRGQRFLLRKKVVPMYELLVVLAAIANIGCFVLELYRYREIRTRKEDAGKEEKRQDTQS